MNTVCVDRRDFDSSHHIFTLLNSGPIALDVNEQSWIQRFKVIKRFSINSVDPFGIAMLQLTYGIPILDI